MTGAEHTDILLLDEHCQITLTELSHTSGLSVLEIRELVELGAFEPLDPAAAEWRFASRCIELGRLASRLMADFGLNLAGVALALTYRERIRDLERRLRELECRLPTDR